MRNPTRQTQLEWRTPDEVCWDELPPEIRERAREWLRSSCAKAPDAPAAGGGRR